MRRKPVPEMLITTCLFVLCIAGCATMEAKDDAPVELAIADRWSGDFPVDRLGLLPDGQQQSRVGYIDDLRTFAAVWQALMPDQTIPAVDFARHLVIFSRNVDFYNRTTIMKVLLAGGGLEILAMETMSAVPVEDRAAMALAVVPRAGVKFIRAGERQIPVAAAR
ncbi:hypothetical protein DSCA_49320 [Desulfosarcina alkanivorans]|uniref:Uncharacterized protein n=1 Tax=Desulfosarcina alkanivorans TaxID=571177 RepID=A0A5K7YMM0_9BACT|nr:hypothetical protein [Desulfosarcina alkanivorans]BBO71002.1 hypothetical protein DSCA_49320 [Desulfosarcina alkanivorans]